MKQIMLCVVLSVVVQIVFTGCYTAHGFAEDLESPGQSIQGHATGQ